MRCNTPLMGVGMSYVWRYIFLAGSLSLALSVYAIEPQADSTSHTLMNWDHKRFERPKFDEYTLSLIQSALISPQLTGKFLASLAPDQAVLFLMRLEELTHEPGQQKTALAALDSLSPKNPIKPFVLNHKPLNPLEKFLVPDSSQSNGLLSMDFFHGIAGDTTKDLNDRMQALTAIIRNEGRNAIPFLRNILENTKENNAVRALILDSRTILGKQTFKEQLDAILKGAPNSTPLFLAAVRGSDLKSLKDFALDKSLPPQVRVAAIQGIAQSDSPQALNLAIQGLKGISSPDEKTQAQIAESILTIVRKNRSVPGAPQIVADSMNGDLAIPPEYLPRIWDSLSDARKLKLSPYDRVKLLESLPLADRPGYLQKIQGVPLSRSALHNSLLNFSHLTPSESNSEPMAEYLGSIYQDSKDRGSLDRSTVRHMGSLFAGDSFDPNGKGFGKHSRGVFEHFRSEALPIERHDLDAGVKDKQDIQVSKSLSKNPRDAVNRLIKAMPIWGDDHFAESADFLFGKPYIASWDLAIKHLGLLFLLKSREVSPEAKEMSDRMVKYWLENLGKENKHAAVLAATKAEEMDFLKNALVEMGQPDILKKMDDRAKSPEHRHANGVINSPPIIYAQQYRNLILKEVLQNRAEFRMTDEQAGILKKQLDENEKELTGMLKEFKTGEYTTDAITGFNTYALVTTVLTAKEPSNALKAMKKITDQEFAPYLIESKYPATPRAGAARTVPFRLAELVHATSKKDESVSTEKLAKAANNYITYLPDLMFHSRGRYMHRGDDQLAPYYFHPTVPYEAAALRVLANDPSFSKEQRAQFNLNRSKLERALLASQKPNGTFALPDVDGDAEGGGAYPSSDAWVNPLVGLALLSLIDDSKKPFTQLGILNPEMFAKKH